MRSLVPKIVFVFLVAACLVCSPAAAQIGAQVSNWTVPTGNFSGGSGAHEGFHTMGDIGHGIGFVSVTPCRIVDTRGPAGPYGAPSLAAGVPRNFALAGGPCTGIPAGVGAYSLNITVVNTLGPGFITIYPQGGSVPLVSTLNYVAGQTIANAAVVPAGTGGGVTAVAGVSGTDLIIDINGYLSQSLNPGNYFSVVTAYTGGGGVIFGSNTDTTAPGDGGHFRAASPQDFSAGLVSSADAATGQTFGVWGITSSGTDCAAGVRGDTAGSLPCKFFGTVGVLGNNGPGLWGVLGISQTRGAQGSRTDSAGNFQTSGVLGFTGTSGVHSFNDITAGGTKFFVMPFAGRPEKQIGFVSVEADEVLTATRGQVTFQRGLAVIKLSQAFMLASEPDGWSVQLTPIGDMATVAVLKMDPAAGEIVVRASRDVTAFYRVEGVRRGYKDFQAIVDNVYFVPESATARMPSWPAQTQKMLIDNKIYNPDGTPNLETARAMGWTKIWEDNEARARKLAESR